MKYFLILLALVVPLSMEGARHKRRPIVSSRSEVNERNSFEQEALAARRIQCLWKDKEYSLVKRQIYDFFDRFPASADRDTFQIQLGNIALYEKDYPTAVAAFEAIRDIKRRDEMRVRRWQALYQMQNYDTLYQEISPLLPLLKGNEKHEATFLFAESTFREALILSHYTEGGSQAKLLAAEALPYYESLLGQKKFTSHAKLALAEIYRLLEHPREAAQLYLELAKSEKENEALLFHAAAMLSKFDDEKATQVFRQVTYLGGTRSAESCYQWMQLLAKRGDWFPLFSERALFLTKLPSYRIPVFHFYTGMVLYQDKKWREATHPLNKSLELGLIYPHDKNALFALVVCAHELCDITLVEKAFGPIKERYSEELGDVALLRALTYRKAGKVEEALKQLDQIVASRYSASVVERSLREKTQLLVQEENWDAAYRSCQIYLESFESRDMVKLAIDLGLHRLDMEDGFSNLVKHIEKGFNKKMFDSDEQPFYLTLLAKGLIKLERFKEGLEILEKQESTGERESLLTLCYLKEGYRPEFIIEHGEKALALDPLLPETDRLHLYLFNAYLDAAKESPDVRLNTQAEEHLYCIIHTFPVSLENRLWLAHRFAKNEEKKGRAIEIFEGLLHIESQLLRFPREAFVLANLYTENEEHEKAGVLLNSLSTLQENSPFAEEIRLALAHHYRAVGEACHALNRYKELEDSSEPMVALAAKLEHCRLLYELLPEDSSAEMLEPILTCLKDLWMKKRIITEPIHLEAAIDYITFQSPFWNEEELLAQLKEIEEHFTLEDDIWSKDYHTARYQIPSRDLVYQAYMRYIEGSIAEIEGERRTAHALFSTLCQGKYAVSKYLVESATRRIRAS